MMQEVLDENGYIPVIKQNRHEFLTQFIANINRHFDALLAGTTETRAVTEFEMFSKISEEGSEAMAAVEGMVAHSRNLHQADLISFTTRLTSVLKDIQIDESINPLDPQQVFYSFTEVMNEFGIANPDENVSSLIIYRCFNDLILKNIDKILKECDQLLVEHGAMSELGLDTEQTENRSGRRAMRPETDESDTSTFGSAEEVVKDKQKDDSGLFNVMQNLLRGNADEAGADDQATRNLAPHELLSILSQIQKELRLEAEDSDSSDLQSEAQEISILPLIDSILKEAGDSPATLDQQSIDVINLVTLLYDAIWQDESLPVALKNLIAKTQIAIIKVALSDTTFFDQEDHPGRLLLNEFASAGIGWVESEMIDKDPLYTRIEELVVKIQSYSESEFVDEESTPVQRYYDYLVFFEDLLKEFQFYRSEEESAEREQLLQQNEEQQERLKGVDELVSTTISDRLKGRRLHPFVDELLNIYFHKFMVMVALKEGQGSKPWKQSVNTIDVLLWSLEARRQTDSDRMDAVNPRLLNNLRRAFVIIQLDPQQIELLVNGLMKIQDEMPEFEDVEVDHAITKSVSGAGEAEHAIPGSKPALAEDDPVFDQVDSLSVGIWLEFSGETKSQSVRCKLAAKVNALDKYIFINRQGVKVLEKSRSGLAQELKDRTVKIITDGHLFSRALESVIGDLRENQQLQQTGSAYQPEPN